MNVLMFTPKLDEQDPFIGFACGWVRALAAKVDTLTVLTLDSAAPALPANVRVYSLEKAKTPGKLALFLRFLAAAREIFSTRPIDVVFCHMFPEFTLLLWPFAAFHYTPIVTWYAHRHAGLKLRLVEKLAAKIVTPSAEGFCLPSPKKVVLGHGIDTELFVSQPPVPHKELRVLSVGRITPIKDLETLIKAVGMLKRQNLPISLRLVGAPMQGTDFTYERRLRALIASEGLEAFVEFAGNKPFTKMPEVYAQADLVVNLCPTGAIDKTVLEAMACGKPVLAANKAFEPLLGPEFLFSYGDFKALAALIERVAALCDQWKALGAVHRERVVRSHSLAALAEKLMAVFESVR